MSRHLQFVFTNAAPGRDEEFNEWYDTCHVAEVLAKLPGFVSGRRYRLNPSQRAGATDPMQGRWRYLALYELETDDLGVTHRATEAFIDARGFTPHGGALAEGHVVWTYSEAGARIAEGDAVLEGKRPLGSAKHLFLAFTNPAAGREQDFAAWYETHVAEVVAHFPGLVTGQLYDRAEKQRTGMRPPWRRLALYDLEADDLDEYHRADKFVRESGVLTPNAGALDPDYAVWVYSELVVPSEVTGTRA